jgi:hypothetical protein
VTASATLTHKHTHIRTHTLASGLREQGTSREHTHGCIPARKEVGAEEEHYEHTGYQEHHPILANGAGYQPALYDGIPLLRLRVAMPSLVRQDGLRP